MGNCPSPSAAARVLVISQRRRLCLDWLLVGGMGQGNALNCHPTRVPERREALLILPVPCRLTLIKHHLERRCFVAPGHV